MLRTIVSGGLNLLWTHRRLWFVCLLISMLSVIDVAFSSLFDLGTFMAVVYIATAGCLKASIATVVIVLAGKAGRWLSALILALYGIASAVNAACFLLYGFGITRKLLIVLGQTNASEVSEFLPGLASNFASALLSWPLWAAVLGAAALYIVVCRANKTAFLFSLGAGSLAGAVFIAALCFAFPVGRSAHFISLRLPKYALEVRKYNKAMEGLISQRMPFPAPESVRSDRAASNLVVVIGESASRGHHSLYGYPLNTTPNLMALSDSLFVFSNAIGSSTGTAGNIERILTFKEDDATCDDWFQYPTIIDLFKNAGYSTFYLSNQEREGLFMDSSGAIAESADHIDYVGSDASDALLYKYDNVIIEPFDRYLHSNDSCKMFVLHLMGSHTNYKNRYPKSYDRFSAEDVMRISANKPWINKSKAKTVAQYDNSILFTDSILSALIDKLANDTLPSVMVYFSDHGENVYDDRDFIGREERYVEVPMFIYLNQAYRNAHPELAERLSVARHLPVSTANIVYSLMSLSATTYPEYYNPSNDFMSPEFVRRKRYVDESPWTFD